MTDQADYFREWWSSKRGLAKLAVMYSLPYVLMSWGSVFAFFPVALILLAFIKGCCIHTGRFLIHLPRLQAKHATHHYCGLPRWGHFPMPLDCLRNLWVEEIIVPSESTDDKGRASSAEK